MYRKFIATIIAASVALTALGASPVLADNNRDVSRALAAILGVAVIGAIIHDKKKKRAHHVPHEVYELQRTPPRSRQVERHSEPQLKPRPLLRHIRRNLLPQECLRSFDTRRGKVRMFPRSCLERNYDHVAQLPQHCATRIKTHKGRRFGFEAHCLRQQGYRLARR